MHLVLGLAFAFASSLLLTGCSLSRTAVPVPETGSAIQGKVFGGQQPISGAHVYLFAANTTGYGGPGLTPSTSNVSMSLLTTGQTDSVGSYVTTDSGGNFSITGDYTCTANTQVYIYALGGNAGSGANSAAGLLAALGNCPGTGNFLAGIPFITVNEVSTIAAAYAMAPFASDATHVSSSGTTSAKAGIQNAFANAAQLADIATGVARTTTPGGNGAVPQSEINTLANILAACVNSIGPGSTACTTLLGNALAGGSTGASPTDTATAAINIAHYPGTSVSALYSLSTGTPPFSPTLSVAPKDLAIAVKFTGGGIGSSGPNAVALDTSGNVWTISSAANTISEFSSRGVALSGASGFTGGGMNSPVGFAIDLSGNIWVANSAGSVSKFSSSGAAISTGLGYLVGGLNGAGPAAIAIDTSNDVWVADDTSFQPHVSELNNGGGAISSSSGYTGAGVINAVSVAIDASGNAWFADDSNFTGVSKFSNSGAPALPGSSYGGGGMTFPGPFAVAIDASGNVWAACSTTLVELSNSGTAISPSTGYTGGGIALPKGIAIDGAGNVWLANSNNGSVSEFSKSGVAITPSTGYTAAGVLSAPYGIAVDGSGNVWVAASGSQSVDELIGAATPVVTSLATAVKNNQIAIAP